MFSPRKNLVDGIYGWNERKKRFSRRQIAWAVDVMIGKGWQGSGKGFPFFQQTVSGSGRQ